MTAASPLLVHMTDVERGDSGGILMQNLLSRQCGEGRYGE
jgi:hypothetical protein